MRPPKGGRRPGRGEKVRWRGGVRRAARRSASAWRSARVVARLCEIAALASPDAPRRLRLRIARALGGLRFVSCASSRPSVGAFEASRRIPLPPPFPGGEWLAARRRSPNECGDRALCAMGNVLTALWRQFIFFGNYKIVMARASTRAPAESAAEGRKGERGRGVRGEEGGEELAVKETKGARRKDERGRNGK